jgi:hypothetical protein
MCESPADRMISGMTTTDYILDSALVLLVLLQIKERRMTTRLLLRPLVILGVAVANYFHSIPTSGNDLLLIVAVAMIGATIGAASGFTAIMRRGDDGGVTTRSGWWSGLFWVLGMGSRFAFAIWIAHGGASTIASFSAHNSITGEAAWTDALLAMAVCEVLGRTLIQAARWRRLEGAPVLSFA